jgi:hypothetical protein
MVGEGRASTSCCFGLVKKLVDARTKPELDEGKTGMISAFTFM